METSRVHLNETSLMTLEEALSAVNGQLVGKGDLFHFSSVATDSRNVQKDSLFVPLVGQNQDGHIYVPKAVESGASACLINSSEYKKNPATYDELARDGVCFLLVENTLYGLQNLSERYVEKFPNLIKVAVTGSSGKTTTKEMMISVLKQKYNCVFTQGNLNSETGLPLSVFNIRSEHECGIFEMGMNRENEIGEISKVLKAKYAVITNIGNAHIGILGSRENIAREKRKIFDYIPADGAAFVPEKDDFADYLLENVRGKKVLFGVDSAEKLLGAKYAGENGLYGIKFLLDGIDVNLPVSGVYNYQNALSVIAVAKTLGLSATQIKTGLESFKNVGGRMEVYPSKSRNGSSVTVVKDCYNANPDSMLKAIELCLSQKNIGKKIFVLGDMKELGSKSAEAHKNIAEILQKSDADYVCFVGGDFKSACADFVCSDGRFDFFDSVDDEALSVGLLAKIGDDSLLLLKGSNSMKLWELLPKILEDEH